MVPAGDVALCARSCVLAPLVPRWRRCASWYASVRWYAGIREDHGRSGFRGRSGQRGGTFLSTEAGSSAEMFPVIVLVSELRFWRGGAGWPAWGRGWAVEGRRAATVQRPQCSGSIYQTLTSRKVRRGSQTLFIASPRFHNDSRGWPAVTQSSVGHRRE